MREIRAHGHRHGEVPRGQLERTRTALGHAEPEQRVVAAGILLHEQSELLRRLGKCSRVEQRPREQLARPAVADIPRNRVAKHLGGRCGVPGVEQFTPAGVPLEHVPRGPVPLLAHGNHRTMPPVTEDPREPLELNAFRALRYAGDVPLPEVLAPPYDVIDPPERTELLARHPDNVVRVLLPDAPEAGAAQVREWLDAGVLVREDVPALWVYEQAEPDGAVIQRGLWGALTLHPWDDGVVVPHENVMPGPVTDRDRLMDLMDGNPEPVWLMRHGGAGAAAQLVAEIGTRTAVIDTVGPDGLRHRLWAVTDADELAEVAADLAPRTAMIADGHHRYTAALRLRDRRRAARGPGGWDRTLAFLLDLDAYPPRIGAIHRHLPGVSLDAACEAVPAAPGWTVAGRGSSGWRGVDPGTGELLLVDGAQDWALLRVSDPPLVDSAVAGTLEPPEQPPSWRALDTVRLHRALLPVWGVDEEAVTYPHDPEEAVRRAAADGGVAVLLPAVAADTMLELAEQGIRMPRKSTLFVPKPQSGLLLRLFADD